jgi:hypothetical protein
MRTAITIGTAVSAMRDGDCAGNPNEKHTILTRKTIPSTNLIGLLVTFRPFLGKFFSFKKYIIIVYYFIINMSELFQWMSLVPQIGNPT